MISQRFPGRNSLFSIPVVLALILAVACVSAAEPAAAPTAEPAAPAIVASTATSAPAAPAETASTGGPGLAEFDIKQAIIDPDRSRASVGTLTLARHTSLSPKWVDPQEAPASRTPYFFIDLVHDAMIRPMPQGTFTLSLAEHFEMTDDFKKATFRLRQGLKFHNGDPLTTEDVKFSFENYSGASADRLHDKTERIEIIDERTIVFHFKEPFIDFLLTYIPTASGAGYIVPAKYYQEVGPDKFKQKPIGVGPYKVVGSTSTQKMTFEAFADYWRKVPHVKTFKMLGVPELATRVAALKTGAADITYFVTGALLRDTLEDPNLRVDPNNSAPFWLFFPGQAEPDNPFHDKRVREAVSLALDREFLSKAETAGMAIVTGNFIPPDKPGYLQREPDAFDLPKAKQLMADAGFPNGFKLDAFTPFPPVFSLGERIMDQLREIGIKGKLNITQRPVFLSQLREHRKGFPGVQIVFSISTGPPDVAAYFRAFAVCDGGSSVTCDPIIDELMAKHDASLDLEERAKLMTKAQEYILNEHIFVPVYINAFAMGLGPRVAGKVSDYTKVYAGLFPYEDVELKPE